MKTTNKNSFVRDIAAWISEHRYGFLQIIFFTLTAISLLWIHHYGEAHNLTNRGLWTRIESYAVASLIPASCMGLFFSDTYRPFKAFIFTVLWGYILITVWCAYWEISYAFPVAAAALITLFYKDIRTEDHFTSNRTIAATILIIWFTAAFATGLLFGHMGYKSDIEKQEFSRQAKETPVIKVVDSKDGYIYTEEYGLEQMSFNQDIPKGSMIHRLPTKDGKVFVTAE